MQVIFGHVILFVLPPKLKTLAPPPASTIVKSNALASVVAPQEMVFVGVVPFFNISTSFFPVVTKFVAVEVLKTVLVAVLVKTIFPVPKFKVLELLLLDEKFQVDNV